MRNFAGIMKNRLSLFCIWAATLMMLLSTVVMHHHHYERICVAVEMCVTPGSVGDIEAEPEESHSHQESGGSCRIHQLHKFIINSGVAKSIRHHILDGNQLAAAHIPDTHLLPASCGLRVAGWQHTATPLSLLSASAVTRRGPPVF